MIKVENLCKSFGSTKVHNGINLEEDRVQSSVYFLMAYGKLVGHLSIRHNINNAFLSLYGGHIGYAVRPTERRKGYATTMLGLALEKCKEFASGRHQKQPAQII